MLTHACGSVGRAARITPEVAKRFIGTMNRGVCNTGTDASGKLADKWNKVGVTVLMGSLQSQSMFMETV